MQKQIVQMKQFAKIEYLFMAYNLVLMLYAFVAIPCDVVLTGKYLFLAAAGSVLVAALAGYTCWQAKKKFLVMQGLGVGFFICVLCNVAYYAGDFWAGNQAHLVMTFATVVASFFCFAALSRAQWLVQWQLIAAVYATVLFGICLLSLWCVYHDVKMTFVLFSYLYVSFERLNNLYIFSQYNETAQFIALSMIFAVFLIASSRKIWVRLLGAVYVVVFLLCLGLTYSRTAMLTGLGCLAISLCYYIWHAGVFGRLWRWASALLRLIICAVACVFIVFGGFQALSDFNLDTQQYLKDMRETTGETQQNIEVLVPDYVKEQAAATAASEASAATSVSVTSSASAVQSAVIIPLGVQQAGVSTAYAAPAQTDLFINTAARELSDLETFYSRISYWVAVCAYLQETPALMITGVSPAQVTPILQEISGDFSTPHTHNVFVQVLFAAGLPALLFFVAIWGVALFGAVKLFFLRKGNFAQGAFPLVLILLFTVIGMQEALICTARQSTLAPAFFMACISVCCLLKQETA